MSSVGLNSRHLDLLDSPRSHIFVILVDRLLQTLGALLDAPHGVDEPQAVSESVVASLASVEGHACHCQLAVLPMSFILL
jgi:hypothetical protein